MTIRSNYHEYQMHCFFELPIKERKNFEYMVPPEVDLDHFLASLPRVDSDPLSDSARIYDALRDNRFVKYRGQWYDVADVEPVVYNGEIFKAGFFSMISLTFDSAIVFSRWNHKTGDYMYDTVIVGYYYYEPGKEQ